MSLVWLPAATRDQHSDGIPWTETTDPKGCLHTTETLGWPTYQGWTIAPHGTVMPHPGVGVTIRQHIPLTAAGFALRHTESQPTNTDYVWQWELIGTSDPHGNPAMYYWPDADDAVLADLGAKLVRPLSEAYGIPLVAPEWLAYPASFGASPVRMSNREFDTYSGWLGHEHVPQNDHGDPGAFPWKRLLTLMENDMPLTVADADLVVDRLLARKLTTGWHEDGTFDPNPATAEHPTVASIWTATRGNVLAISNGKATALATQIAEAVVAALPPGSGTGITPQEIQTACENAVRTVLGGLNDPVSVVRV